MRAAQTVREVAVAKHMKPGQIASGVTGEVARKRNRRRLVTDPVRLMRQWCWATSGSITARRSSLSALSVEPLMAVGLVVLVIVLEPDQLEIHFRAATQDRRRAPRHGKPRVQATPQIMAVSGVNSRWLRARESTSHLMYYRLKRSASDPAFG